MAHHPRALPRVTMAGRRPQTSTVRTHPVTRAGPVAPADRVALVDRRAGLLRVGPVTRADPVAPADREVQADLRAALVDLAPADPTTRADPVARADRPVAPADPVHGMGISSVATSMEPRGETGPRRGDLVSRRTQIGADRCPRPETGG